MYIPLLTPFPSSLPIPLLKSWQEMTEYRPLHITIISAQGLKNVNIFFRMSVYVVVSVSGEYNIENNTHVCRHGGSNPQWNHRIKLTFPESAISTECLIFQLLSHRALGDKEIGVVSIPIQKLIDSTDTSEEQIGDYQVSTMLGKPKGSLKFSYKFGEKFNDSFNTKYKKIDEDETVTAYPAEMVCMQYKMGCEYQPGVLGGYYYPPRTPGYGGYPQYGYPQAPGYIHWPTAMGYAYPLVQRQDRSFMDARIGNGGKLAVGLGAGLIGSLMVGEMVSNAGEIAAYGV